MSSDVNTMPKPEWIPNEGSGARFLAYSYAISGKEGSALTSSEGKAKGGSGISGLMKELEKTKLDV
ncbi:MAG: hypothetical protein SPL61_04045 [Saccharofermentans sp.]|jgi:hypothetical protein|nr:hypothetical protein [Saccharofermentans sp.]